jgi:hypothetical protein
MFHYRDDDDTSAPEKISLDELYEGKQKRDLRILGTFKTILTRVHNQIKLTSRQKVDQQFCWFIVPEFVLGVPSYNNSDCVVYLIEKLQENGFQVKYTHPNLLLISWQHWVPGYVRKELKKKTGVEVDGHGRYVNKLESEPDSDEGITIGFGRPGRVPQLQPPPAPSEPQAEKTFKDVRSYNPSGGLVYKDQVLHDLHKKLG